ncbi:MAG TPA: NUDIX domain-containing protein [Chloroflexia bacterium]|nr:NUDIX domain-containing protein [Chloroflexia bacterium]
MDDREEARGPVGQGTAQPAAGDPASDYDPSRYPRPSVTVDLVILTVQDNDLRVLLVERAQWPFAGMWALPGGFLHIDEAVHDTARRELEEETGLAGEDIYLEQLYTFGAPDRDPRTRVITVAYFALVPADVSRRLHPGSDAAAVRWFSVYDLPQLAFDHARIVDVALRRVRSKLDWTPIAFRLLPEQFTMTQLRNTYQIILHRELDKQNFSKKMLQSRDKVIEPVPNALVKGAHRPAQLYRFVEEGRYEWGATAGDQP